MTYLVVLAISQCFLHLQQIFYVFITDRKFSGFIRNSGFILKLQISLLPLGPPIGRLQPTNIYNQKYFRFFYLPSHSSLFISIEKM